MGGTTTTGSTAQRLDERYGRRRPSPRRRRALVGAAAAAGAALVAWTVWAGLGLAGEQAVSHQVVGFSDPTPTGVVLTFQVTKDPAATVSCDVRALAEDFTTVGWRTVELGPAQDATLQQAVEIRTQAEAVSAEVMGCELVEG
ncbi:DUF4307 domain-containing protein [Pseudokineococcus basanitobsidens]|uniref:DUF4307 domain-containing protein n=1 Tax=Pseudokineococcus basanitobsidens TaxID=1926649 RepID=A0ABU8RME6_9ACTN